VTIFPVNKLPSLPLEENGDDAPVDTRSAAVADRALTLPAVIETTPLDTIENAVLKDGTNITDAKSKSSVDIEAMVNTALQEEVTAEELEESFGSVVGKTKVYQELEDYYIELGILLEDTEYTETDIRYTTNLMIAEQVFRDRLSDVERDTGVVGYFGDFVDRYIIRQIPIGALEDLTFRSERKGADLLQAALTMNPKEYKSFIEAYADEAASEGFFVSDNYFALQAAYDEAVNAGYDPFAKLNSILAAAELVPGVKAILKSGKALKSGKSLSQADSVVGRVAALEGQEAAAEVGERILRNSPEADPEIITKMGPSANDPGTALVRPQSAKVTEILEENNLARTVLEMNRKGVFGRVADPKQIGALAKRVSDDYKGRVTNALNDYKIRYDNIGNPVLHVDFGTLKKGTPFTGKRAEANATKAAQRTGVAEAKAAPVDPEDLSKGYVVRVEKRLDTTGLADEFDVNQVEYGFLRETMARLFGSNAALDDEYLTALANMAEAGQSAIKKEAKVFEKALVGIPRNSRKAIVRVFKELRDGKDAALKEGYTQQEFADKFKSLHPEGLAPTQKDLDAFGALTHFEDTAWLLRANEALTRYVKKDYWSLELPSGRTIGKRVDTVDPETKVLNVHTNAVEVIDEVGEVDIWRLDIPLEDGTQYISNPLDVSILDHADVMGFNSGGRRINPKANYFITLDGDTPRAIITAFSGKQAKKGVDQLNNIRLRLKELGKDIKDIKPTDELDDLITKNNDWNPSITSFEEFAALVSSKGWDLTKKISFKERGEEIVDEAVDSLHQGEKWDTYVRTQLHRYDDVLMDFGGGEAYNVDPVNAILDEFASATSHYTHRAYTYNAAAAWTKRALRKGSGVRRSEAYPKDDYLNQVQHAEITGTSQVANRLRHQRSVIRRRLKMKGPLEQRFASYGREASEYVFDKTGLKLTLSDPSNALLNIGFQSAFGFFNTSQFFMQGMHAATIIAISPKQGVRGAAAVLPLRLAMSAPTPAARKLAVKRLAKAMGETEENMDELVEYMQSSGRTVMEGDAMELGTGPSYGASGWKGENYLPSAVSEGLDKATVAGRKVLDLGLIPFNAGERLSRMTGINTAFFEFKAKYPNTSALSDKGRAWITAREQRLTFDMTAAGRSYFQSGIMKVPTQWLSYSFRSMEAVVLGRGFTAAERARLFGMLVPFYGLTGLGLESAADWATEKFGVEDKEAFIAMKYGVLDYLIAELTPVETAVSRRLAPITAFTDLYSNIVGGEATALEVLGGPSGSIASGILGQFHEALQEVAGGHTVSLTQDALRVLRQPSGIDNVAKGVGIMVNGMYRSKTGTVVPVELKTSDALISFLGFSPLEVAEFYSRQGGKFNSSKDLKVFSKEMMKDWDSALLFYETDEDKGAKMLREIHTKIALSGFSADQQQKIRRDLMKSRPDKIYLLELDLIRREKNLSATILNKTLRGEE